MTQNLTLVTQKPFGSLTCNFYKDDAIENEFYMTTAKQKLSPSINITPIPMSGK